MSNQQNAELIVANKILRGAVLLAITKLRAAGYDKAANELVTILNDNGESFPDMADFIEKNI